MKSLDCLMEWEHIKSFVFTDEVKGIYLLVKSNIHVKSHIIFDRMLM